MKRLILCMFACANLSSLNAAPIYGGVSGLHRMLLLRAMCNCLLMMMIPNRLT